MLVENIIPRNVIINRGVAEVGYHISRDNFSTSTLSSMLYLFYYTEQYCFIFYHGVGSSGDNVAKYVTSANEYNNIFHKRVVFVKSLSAQSGRGRQCLL